MQIYLLNFNIIIPHFRYHSSNFSLKTCCPVVDFPPILPQTKMQILSVQIWRKTSKTLFLQRKSSCILKNQMSAIFSALFYELSFFSIYFEQGRNVLALKYIITSLTCLHIRLQINRVIVLTNVTIVKCVFYINKMLPYKSVLFNGTNKK